MVDKPTDRWGFLRDAVDSEVIADTRLNQLVDDASPDHIRALHLTTINRSFPTEWDNDGNDATSYVLILGSFSEGALQFEDGSEFSQVGVWIAIPRRVWHRVLAFTGERYSVVRYDNRKFRPEPLAAIATPAVAPLLATDRFFDICVADSQFSLTFVAAGLACQPLQAGAVPRRFADFGDCAGIVADVTSL